MSTPSVLFANAVKIVQQCRALMIYQALPMIVLGIGMSVVANQWLIPIFRTYRVITESSELDPTALLALPEELKSAALVLVPIIALAGFMLLILRSSIYAGVARSINGIQTRFSDGTREGMHCFWAVLGMLIVITALSTLLQLLDTVIAVAGGASIVFEIIFVLLGLVVGLAALFAWPAIVMRRMPIGRALMTSIRVTIKNGWTVSLVLLMILFLQLVVACLYGAAVGLGFYITPIAGVVLGVIVFLLSIPVYNFSHVLLAVLFDASQPQVQSHSQS